MKETSIGCSRGVQSAEGTNLYEPLHIALILFGGA